MQKGKVLAAQWDTEEEQAAINAVNNSLDDICRELADLKNSADELSKIAFRIKV